jgi:hypothetical protein
VRRHRARLEDLGSRNGKNTLHLHASRGRKVVRGTATIAAPDCVVGRVERQGKLVSKSEIIDVVWRGWAVEEANLYESGSLQTEMYRSSPAGPSAGIRATTSEPNRPDIGAALHSRSELRTGQLHPNGTQSRLPLCRAGETGEAGGPVWLHRAAHQFRPRASRQAIDRGGCPSPI